LERIPGTAISPNCGQQGDGRHPERQGSAHWTSLPGVWAIWDLVHRARFGSEAPIEIGAIFSRPDCTAIPPGF